MALVAHSFGPDPFAFQLGPEAVLEEAKGTTFGFWNLRARDPFWDLAWALFTSCFGWGDLQGRDFLSHPLFRDLHRLLLGGGERGGEGAPVRVSFRSAEEKAQGICACSAGNHAQGVAFSAAALDVSAPRHVFQRLRTRVCTLFFSQLLVCLVCCLLACLFVISLFSFSCLPVFVRLGLGPGLLGLG